MFWFCFSLVQQLQHRKGRFKPHSPIWLWEELMQLSRKPGRKLVPNSLCSHFTLQILPAWCVAVSQDPDTHWMNMAIALLERQSFAGCFLSWSKLLFPLEIAAARLLRNCVAPCVLFFISAAELSLLFCLWTVTEDLCQINGNWKF